MHAALSVMASQNSIFLAVFWLQNPCSTVLYTRAHLYMHHGRVAIVSKKQVRSDSCKTLLGTSENVVL